MRSFVCGLVLLAVVFACSDSNGPPQPVPNSQLHIVQQAATAPPLLSDTASFYAVVGQDRELRMFYQGSFPGDTGEEFLRFKVPGDGLLRRPDGTAFQPGDSILISIKVLDPQRFLLEFQPTGLQFSADHQAVLAVEYGHSEHDYNGDGRVDSLDAEIESRLDIWQRRPPDTLWYRLGAANYESYQELEAKIPHFTDHAIAW